MKVSLKIDPERVERTLLSFIKENLSCCGYKNGVFGISGGLDSAVTSFLSAKALGKKNVLGLIMPYGDAFDQDVEHARMIVEKLEIRSKIIDITPLIDLYYKENPSKSKVIKGNKMARERMSILYDFSAREKALIIGTSNKTELLLGYGTIHGDMACGINPLGDLYKTQVRELARFIGVPEAVINKAPTAGLWPGQTDEDEIGLTYDVIDQILYLLVDQKKSIQEAADLGYDRKAIETIIGLIESSEFKRKLPPIAKVSDRTFGIDFISPLDKNK